MDIDLLADVRSRLNDAKGQWTQIAKATNYNHSTLCRIANGLQTNPRYQTLIDLRRELEKRGK